MLRQTLRAYPERRLSQTTTGVHRVAQARSRSLKLEVTMERGRILILGQTKDSTYEIRNLLDNRRYELEIALSREVAKQILAQRRMDLLIIHTEMLEPEMAEFFEVLEERGIELPVFLLGEEADKLRESVPVRTDVSCFEKPYPVDQMVASIQAL